MQFRAAAPRQSVPHIAGEQTHAAHEQERPRRQHRQATR
jgi:hypothetical protein